MAKKEEISTLTGDANDGEWKKVTGTDVGTKRSLDVYVQDGTVSTTPSSAVTNTIYNPVIAAANVEQSLAIPGTIVGYLIRTRGLSDLRLSHAAAGTTTSWISIAGNASYEDNHKYTGLTLYFQSPTISEVVEVVTWA